MLTDNSINREPDTTSWNNPGLLIDDAARQEAEEKSPDVFFAFDWPEFRAEWTALDDHVKEKKKKLQVAGIRATIGAGLSAALLAISGIAGLEIVQPLLVWAGALVATISLYFGCAHFLEHKSKTGWLNERLYVERLRQFYHQFILENTSVILAAVGNKKKQSAFKEFRDDSFTSMKLRLRTHIRDSWTDVDEDENAKFAMLFLDADEQRQTYVADRANIIFNRKEVGRQLLEQVGRQRFRVQKDFVDLELDDSSSSKTFAHKSYHHVFIVGLVFAPVFALLAALSHLLNNPGLAATLVALSAVSTATGLSSRVLEAGLGYGKDIKRYGKYLQRIRSASNEFFSNNLADPSELDINEMLKCWLELEKYSYLEMREFFHNHKDDNFFS